MQNLTKNISDIIIKEALLINEKVKGLNFLEILKIQLIEKIQLLVSSDKFSLEQSINFETESDINLRKITISINYYKDFIAISRKKINHDSLFISFTETASIDIFKNNNNFQSLFLYKNTGVTLPQSTIINAKLNKNTIFVEIKNKDVDQTLTN